MGHKAISITRRDPRATDPFLALVEDCNAGNAGALQPGDIRWMTAGCGIIHRELTFRNEHAHTLQLWVNLPARR